MRRVARLIGPMLACVVLVPALAAAQASITGVVSDTSGAVLPGVTVEASSPVLIEKVRSVTSDSSGQYRIVDLRPGVYSVTFTLPGFAVIKREGIELAGSFTATVNAEMRVGQLEETITVTGQAAVVDVQNTTAQRTLTHEVIDNIPAGRSHLSQAVLIPGLSSSQGATRGTTMDVGGTNNLQNTLVSIHGGRQSDTRLMLDGVRIGNIAGEGQWTNYVPDQGGAQELTIDYSAVSAEQITGGLRINLVPREGGNSFRGSAFITAVNENWQTSNVDADLTARGLGTPNRMKQAYDFNPSGGGPIVKDRLWFYSSTRHQNNESYIAGTYANKNAGDPTKWLYEPDLTQQSVFKITQRSYSTRLTWQASQRNKITGYYDTQTRNWDDNVPNVSPEAITMWRFPRLGLTQVSWTSPFTNKLLFEGRAQLKAEAFYDLYNRENPIYKSMIPVIEQSTGLFYRAPAANGQASFYGRTDQNLRTFQGSASYVTGAHAFKVGVVDTWARAFGRNEDNDYHLTYRFNNGIPNQLTQRATPTESLSVMKAELGIYAQDKWTVNKLTLNGGIRYDYLAGYFPELHLGPAYFVPNRDITFAREDSIAWKDISPRIGGAYDLFGDGKTALKASIGRYVLASASTVNSPSGRVANTITRTWTDANGNFIPDCDLFNTQQNGECGVMSNTTFGQQQVQTTFYNEEMIRGFGVRPYNWEFSASVQREIVPRVGMEFGYFRRWFGNFQVTDNRANATSDWTQYSITAPSDPRLPNGGGYQVSGLYDLNPNKVGQTNNYVTFASDYGKMWEHWNGVDLTVNARPGNGVLVQGGLSTGRTTLNACDVRANLPELSLATPFTINTTTPYCDITENWLTQVKLLGTYTVPKVAVNFAATFQSVAGFPILSTFNAPNAQVQTSLGRPLSGGAANAAVALVAPGTMFNDRANQLDLRFGKPVRFGRARTVVNLDIYNALNGNPVLLQNNNYAAWLRPQKILEPRLFKISAQFDF